jgi:4-deoxy-L-threo-5-hexosulose-uronate ketol-isomerase
MRTTRYAIHPEDFKNYNTTKIREAFVIEKLFIKNSITHTYSHYDRMIVGGVEPVTQAVSLQPIDELKADFFLQRRELGIINVGNSGSVTVDGKRFDLKYKEALYIGRGSMEITFHPSAEGNARFYYNSSPAHISYPTKKITLAEAETVELGTMASSNHRVIRKLLVNSVLETCQLQMGLTELKSGSVWNTMPPHTHDRRMEVYFYFEIPDDNTVSHFLGTPEETRHVWLKNNEAVFSPPWSIHCGAGTSNYSFIWSMAGENMDYGDMDTLKPTDLR